MKKLSVVEAATSADSNNRGGSFSFVHGPPISLSKFIKIVGITYCTAWRWRRRQWLATVNICGRVYVTAEEIARFNARAAAGEFAREHVTPQRVQPPRGA